MRLNKQTKYKRQLKRLNFGIICSMAIEVLKTNITLLANVMIRPAKSRATKKIFFLKLLKVCFLMEHLKQLKN